MSSTAKRGQDYAAERARLDRALSVLDRAHRAFYVRRPILLHDFNRSGIQCPCGCNSTRAILVDELDHLDVLLDAFNGRRSLRQKLAPEQHAAFDLAVASPYVQRLDMPVRCYSAQLPILLDRESSIIYVNGGVRAGKTTIAAERLASLILEDGGYRAKFLWVSPQTSLAWTGLSKLVRGEATDRLDHAIFPSELVAKQPRDKNAKDWTIRLIDGSEIEFHHAGRKGANLKSTSYRHIVFDEATESDHEENFTILQGRLVDFGGSMVVPTTPKFGHWLRKHVDGTPRYDSAE